MTRREIREQVFILLFQREFYGREPFDEQKETYMETKEWTEKDQAYIEEHMAKIMDKLPEKYVEEFDASYQKAANRLVREFTQEFCFEDGSIDWEKLVKFNSGN